MNIFTNNTKEVEENILNAEKPENKRKIQNDRNERSAKIRGVEPNHLQVEIENIVQHLKKLVSTAVDDLQDESHQVKEENSALQAKVAELQATTEALKQKEEELKNKIAGLQEDGKTQKCLGCGCVVRTLVYCDVECNERHFR